MSLVSDHNEIEHIASCLFNFACSKQFYYNMFVQHLSIELGRCGMSERIDFTE